MPQSLLALWGVLSIRGKKQKTLANFFEILALDPRLVEQV
jgi:hypothetical protein